MKKSLVRCILFNLLNCNLLDQLRLVFPRSNLPLIFLILFFLATESAYSQSPNSLGGRTLQINILSGVTPFPGTGSFSIISSPNDNFYAIVPITGETRASSGTYTYTKNGPNSAQMTLIDVGIGTLTVSCIFNSANAGTYTLTSATLPSAKQSGTFRIFSGISPSSIAGKSVTVTVTSGINPFQSTGKGIFQTATYGNTYSFLSLSGGLNSTGTYIYSLNSTMTALLILNDSLGGQGLMQQLSFDTASSGAMLLRVTGNPGYQTATFAISDSNITLPSIVIHPQNQTVISGASATFSVIATGTQPLNYQWQLNGANLKDATNATLILTNVIANQAGNYTVIVSNSGGTISSQPAILAIQSVGLVDPLDHWTLRSSPTAANLQGITFGNGTFVVVGRNGAILNSSDGLSWVLRPSGTTIELSGVAYGNGLYAAVGNNGTILISSEGVNWKPLKSGTSNNLYGIAYGGGQFVAVGLGIILSSTNGLDWIPRQYGTNSYLRGVAYGNGIYVAAGSGIFTSGDGITWIPRAFPTDGSEIHSVVFGNSQFAGAQLSGSVLISSDAISWTRQNSGSTNQLFSVGYGNGQYVLGGKNGTLLTSNDGTTWLSRRSGTGMPIQSTVYGNATFVAVGDMGTILQSDPFTYFTPEIIDFTLDNTVTNGGTARFSVIAKGTSPLCYQWKFNSLNINGATNASLILTNVGYGNAGTYQVMVTNLYGKALSKICVLTVVPNQMQTADVSYCAVRKQQNFFQSGIGNPVLYNTNRYSFAVIVAPTTPASLISASIQTPAGATKSLSYNTNTGYANIEDNFSSLATFDTAYGTGNYLMVTKTVHDGTNTIPLILPPAMAYPNAPHISNFAAAQNINPATNFMLLWDPFIGGTTNDVIRVQIHDPQGKLVYRSPERVQTGYFNGTITSMVIPSNTLVHGQTYNVGIMFYKFVYENRTAYAGVPCVMGAASGTMLQISTTTEEWQMPGDFGSLDWIYEELPDTRPPNINPTRLPQPKALNYVGTRSYQNGSLMNNGNCYGAIDTFPYVMLDTNLQWLLMHPAIGRAVSLGFRMKQSGQYQITGAFARANNSIYAGNGVAVAIARNLDTTNLLFQSTIPSSVRMNESNLFDNATSANFNLKLTMSDGDTLRFLVFCGPTGTSDMGFDVTALRYSISREDGLPISQPPTITEQPLSRTVNEGATLSLSVTATGTEPLRFQWRFNNSNLLGATNALLLLSQVNKAFEGNYQVVINNWSGSVKSQIATLKINSPLQPLQIVSPQFSTNGQFSFRVNGPAGLDCIIQNSSNIVDWISIATNRLVDGTFLYTEKKSTVKGPKIYRAAITFP